MQKSIRSHEASLKFSFFCLWLTYGEQNLNILKPNSVETVQAVSEGISGKELFFTLTCQTSPFSPNPNLFLKNKPVKYVITKC